MSENFPTFCSFNIFSGPSFWNTFDSDPAGLAINCKIIISKLIGDFQWRELNSHQLQPVTAQTGSSY